jgi:hypothetical protein
MEDPILVTVSAGAVSTILTNLYKMAMPTAPSWALVLMALFIGVWSAVLVGLANGAVLDIQTIAGMILQGTIAAGGAAGIDQISKTASAKREAAQEGA